MKEIRIFIASSMELLPERNYLSYLTLAHEAEFEKRGFRVRLSKWEYVDPSVTGGRTEDRYLDEMFGCDAALVLFRNIAGRYTREEQDKALAAEKTGTTRLKTHEILFAADGAPNSDAARLRSSLDDGTFGIWSDLDELRERFLALIGRVAQYDNLLDAPFGGNVREITAFLAADDELAAERDAFADTVLNVNELLICRGLRIVLRFYDPRQAGAMLDSSEMGLVIYGTNCRVFGRDEIDQTLKRLKEGRQNPKRFYVFFRDLDPAAEKVLDEAFRTFRNYFVNQQDHFFPCHFGDINALRLSFLLSIERFAGESVREYYSTVNFPSAPVFAGREDDLLKLCRQLEPVAGKFPFGRLPVVTGLGGTGKSELASQFARQLRVQYPGGVFQVDMEHVKTWDGVFLGLLNGVPNNGVPVGDYLEIKKEAGEGDSGRSRPLTGADVRNALLARARRSGPVLLVLDNIEDCRPFLGLDGGFLKAFPSGFSERVLVNVIATARDCNVTLRPTDWAVEIPLEVLSPEAAQEVLLADRPAADEAERKAAGHVAELLGYRALYLRRVPALIGDRYAPTICDSYAELARSLEEDLLGTVAAKTDETHLPQVLWKKTCERLGKMPLGAECVKLAEAAAFFPPEGFPRHILEHLWKTVVAPGQDERKFARAVEIIRHHNIFQSTDPVRIHRLDREAILHAQGGEDSELLDAVGRSLAGYYGATAEIWLSLAKQFPRIFQWIPESIMNAAYTPTRINGISISFQISFQLTLLRANPAFADIFPWEKLDGRTWVWLLREQPQFANKCPWDKLDGRDWARLLREQPQFADKCSWDKLDGRDWARLLRAQSQFADKCSWDKLDGLDLAILLREQPQFADRYPVPLEKLTSWDLAYFLLPEQPQFADRYPVPWDKLEGWEWTILLREQPQFADRYPVLWEKVSGSDWTNLLGKQPQFADNCPWEKLHRIDWVELLGVQPQFADKCPWEKLDGRDWTNLLGKQPQFADRCPWEKLVLDGEDWANLLKEQPQFADKCPWETLDSGNWAYLLAEQPLFADKCPWEDFDGWNWAYLLAKQPQFADKCRWKMLVGCDWSELLGWQPQFADKCHWETLDGTDWSCLLAIQPQFADKCDWRKLSEDDWEFLLEFQPQFADRRPRK